MVKVKWSTSATAGRATIYHRHSGAAYAVAIDRATDTLTASGSAHLKLGYYRNPAITGTSITYHDEARVGKTFNSADPAL